MRIRFMNAIGHGNVSGGIFWPRNLTGTKKPDTIKQSGPRGRQIKTVRERIHDTE